MPSLLNVVMTIHHNTITFNAFNTFDTFKTFKKYYVRYVVLVPSPSETWFRGMSVGESFRDVCRAGLTLKRCSQLAAFAIQPVG